VVKREGRDGKGKGGREGEGRTPAPPWESAKVATLNNNIYTHIQLAKNDHK